MRNLCEEAVAVADWGKGGQSPPLVLRREGCAPLNLSDGGVWSILKVIHR